MIDLLIEKIKRTGAPVVVGLDPLLKFIPDFITKDIYAEYGETLAGASEAIWEFNKDIIDHIYDLIPAVKPQIAMYEQFGIDGIKVFHKTCAYCRAKGLIVIGDIKRGDIGSTSEAYAIGHLGKTKVGENYISAFYEDFITVNPYFGTDGVKPFLDIAKEENKGLFILVKTSNPGSGEFQDKLIESKPLYELVAEKVVEWGIGHIGQSGYSHVGAVVGATYPEQGKRLREIMPKSFILVPGYGAQGGKATDLAHFFNADGLGAIISSSRGIIAAYQEEKYKKFSDEGYAEAARVAVLDMIDDIRSVTHQ